MIRRSPRSTRTDTLLPYTTLFRSVRRAACSPKPYTATVVIAASKLTTKYRLKSFNLTASRGWMIRSEEHTSELQSLMRISYAVFCLKKKKNNKRKYLAIINTQPTTKNRQADTNTSYDNYNK